MFNALIDKRQTVLKKLNLKNDLFCKAFATDPQIIGNASQAYLKVYGGSYETATSASRRLIEKPEIVARINEYLSTEGFNDVNIDKQHLFLINQKKDLNVSMKGIEHYNKLKKRVTDRLEITAPKPIMELEDDEVIVKIDKSKARDGLT